VLAGSTTSHRRIWLIALAAATLFGMAGCGSSERSNASGGAAKRGGTLTVLDVAGGVDSLDPGYWYYQSDYTELAMTTQRTLYGWEPNKTSPTPDLALDLPQLTDGGRTMTIRIRRGIHYSPPLQNREVASDDFKYALERCFLPQVGNGYAPVYFSEIVGADAFRSRKAKTISGIETPDAHTLVIKTKQPVGVLGNGNALTLPCSVPVPRAYAQKYDASTPSEYGEHQVFTGAYMIAGAGTGTIPRSGYAPGRRLVIVRNPSWKRSTDFRPAYLDKVIFQDGNDVTVASRKVLSGTSLISGDYAAPPPAILKQALQRQKSQITIRPSQSVRYIALNTKVKPLDDPNVRKAIAAITDRVALRATRGGPAMGPIATHFVPPEMPGFSEAGGLKGPGFDFMSQPTGNRAVAEKYLKAAGYADGMYHGPPLLMVADNQPPASTTAQAFEQQLTSIGFKTTFRQVPHATLIGKFCGTPKAAVAICPTLGWGKDFFDSQSLLDPVFNGRNIVPVGNTNIAQANDAKINAGLDSAQPITNAGERARLYAQLDRAITAQVFVIPWLWDNQVGLASKNVKTVWSKFNTTYDISYTSLK
jgi:peptide/nickel transport system substrate-binding protein